MPETQPTGRDKESRGLQQSPAEKRAVELEREGQKELQADQGSWDSGIQSPWRMRKPAGASGQA